MWAGIVGTILVDEVLSDVVVIGFVDYGEINLSLVSGSCTTTLYIEEVVVTEKYALARTSTELVTNQHIAVLQHGKVVDRCSVGCTSKAHKG